MAVTESEAAEVEPTWSKAATAAAAVFGVLATTLTTFATATGGLARLFRDEHTWTLIALASLALGLVVACGGPAIKPGRAAGSRSWRNRCFAIAAVLFVLSLHFGTTAAVKAASIPQGPRISGDVKSTADGPVLEVQVVTSGLRSSGRVHVEVRGLTDEPQAKGQPGQLLYSIVTGGDSSGDMNLSVDQPFPAGRFDRLVATAWLIGSPLPNCTHGEPSGKSRSGCLLIGLGPRQALPQVQISLASHQLTVRVKGGRATQQSSLRLTVTGMTGRARSMLYDAMLAPDSSGSVDFVSVIPLGGTHLTGACAAVGVGSRPSVCGSPNAWAQTSIPVP
jgi:hypothetical protein